jgi:hypothetical protein
MSMEEIQRIFPLLTPENHRRTSDADFNYNCLAFALGDSKNWWDPPAQFGYYWPPGFSPDHKVDTVVKIITLHGYIIDLAKHEVPTSEAIAIYADGENWTHFSKYRDGQWFSKIGEDHDISHSSLDILEGNFFGEVVRILSRPIK